ncbi:hypothetical protein F383_36129 [Gossypium arboreum]|uniref:Uncharacterized protein n=1 Tax=Gossypium arboreum TaxID=29729 RepID=A0A0B0N8P8_GOSAR|nr:hypothetical protein F383_36129 [Gossypium arboreum]
MPMPCSRHGLTWDHILMPMPCPRHGLTWDHAYPEHHDICIPTIPKAQPGYHGTNSSSNRH